ncbi:hypothetical protein TruAng_011638 [Truncatella angustata]|nr:hypothetical protein TruAng_011638 [Truncatella angustata]
MRISLFTLFLGALTSAIPLEDAALNTRAIECSDLPAVTDEFDEIQVLPALPQVNAIIAPVPNGTYLAYTNAGYANIGSLSNVKPPSLPNDIYVSPRINNAVITPAFNRANAFKLTRFRYACIGQTQLSILELPSTCTFDFICNVFGSSQIRKKSFKFQSDNILGSTFNIGTFGADFANLSQCSVQVASGSVAGLLESPFLQGFVVLAIDNVENQGQLCARRSVL